MYLLEQVGMIICLISIKTVHFIHPLRKEPIEIILKEPIKTNKQTNKQALGHSLNPVSLHLKKTGCLFHCHFSEAGKPICAWTKGKTAQKNKNIIKNSHVRVGKAQDRLKML